MNNSSDKILTIDNLIKIRNQWKNESKRIVFTNGCFDILHLGHIDYLEKASQLGDKLIVAINTDASVRKLKGEKRPVNPEYARARLLAALGFVDAVTYFEEDTPHQLICRLLPDVLVKGSDYKIDNIVGAKEVIANGGKVITIDLVEGYSTTRIIEKMKQ
ncbi:MAG: D-glycero-beta-D-manno-heptose 1-phosphate adenylyltransferase [Flammeovirgaceae bacterium]